MYNPKNLIEFIKKDNETVIKRLYNDHKKGFLLFATRYDLSADDVLDVYQDAIIALIENAKKGKIDALNSSISTYLFSIGKFMIFQKLKKGKKTFAMEDFSHLEYESEVYDEEETNLQVLALQKAFHQLGDQCRKILRLFYYEEKKLDDIQKELNYSNKDVLKSQKSRCLKQLKELTKEN